MKKNLTLLLIVAFMISSPVWANVNIRQGNIEILNPWVQATNEKNADLFISIHTNSMPKEKASSTSGIETFFLSPARSERAKKVAALENKDDIREMSESSKNVLSLCYKYTQ